MGSENGNERVMVDSWDWVTRVLHWLNAGFVIALILLVFGKEGMESIGIKKEMREPVNKLHAYMGHAFIVTFFLRVVWGFIGNRYAKWGDMIPYSKERRHAIGQNLKWYLSGFKGAPYRTAGHDPLASVFYIVLFAVLALQAVTGIIMSGIEFHTFPGTLFTGGASDASRKALGEALEDVHESGMFFMFFFIAAHLFGIVVHEVKEKTGLFSSMIHGKKYFPKE
ncbi:MAG: cytochrome b/b6 domain-containing protein [Deltaproteobacteria bacterium]|nr:cytochrome b/b6 domain-containing protein [Deltaproteobacteria bacterium]